MHTKISTSIRRSCLAVILVLTLQGCATLPSSGPTAAQIKKSLRGGAAAENIDIIDVDTAVASSVELGVERPDELLGALASVASEGRVDIIGPGDVLAISVYEIGVSLFAPDLTRPTDTAPGPGARAENMAALVVSEAGTIKVPYAGTFRVAGLNTLDVQRLIEGALKSKSQSPQVLVSIRDNVSNVVYVSGDVSRPGKQPLSLARQRLLDAVADAGGARTSTADTLVRFNRNGQLIEQRLASIRPGSKDDLLLLPGDRIELLKAPRTYTVFGATSNVAQVPFESERVSLAEAVARVGGPSDTMADPAAVFLFRFEKRAGGEAPVVYRLNLLKPQSYFVAQKFAMRDKDVIYMATAASNQPSKLVQIINQLFAPLVLARQITNNN